MVTRHTYASTDEFREYLAGTSYSSGWTSDSVVIRRILESSSKRIDNYVGMQSFGVRTETHYFDIGKGKLRTSPQISSPKLTDSTIGISDTLSAVVPLDDWLISATTVTSYKATDRDESETLTEGYNNDYLLEPYNSTPKVLMKLNEDTAKAFHGGQQTLAIAGNWGYSNDTSPEKTTTGAITSTTIASFGVNDASSLSAGQVVLIGAEQMYITSISSNTLTVERAVNGTTATTHSAGTSVYTYLYEPIVVQACLDLAKVYFRDRDMGTTLTIGTGEQETTRSDISATTILSTLDQYRSTTPVSEVFF
tara:strand:- start:736 stop:1659 length:924 start_codon:yes stop_codon:yes gene_type:complete